MVKTNSYIIFILALLNCFSLFGQKSGNKVPLETVLKEITKEHAVTFNYESTLLKNIKVKLLPKEWSLTVKLDNLSIQTDLIFNKISETVITISQPSILCGYLYDRTSEQPLLGVTIQGRASYTTSDQNGYFELKRPNKSDFISFSFMGLQTIKRAVNSFSTKECETIYMTEQLEVMSPLIVQGYLVRGIDKRADWTTSIDYNKFSLLPGLIESDVLQTVQALPSITSVDETVSNINIRGGSNDQNLILWDGIKMYQTGHFFGLISSFNPHMTQQSTVINNGTDVSLTDGVSGTIHMQTDQEVDNTFSGVVGVNFLNAEVFSNIPTSEKSSLQIASRKSLNDLWSTPTYTAYFDRVTQYTEAQNNSAEVTNSDQGFNFNDASLRWLYELSDKDVIRLNFITINNDLTFNESAFLNGVSQTRQSSASQNSIAAALNYKREWNEDFTSAFTITESNYKLQAINANVLSNQRFLQENRVSETNFKLENILHSNLWKFKMGYDFTELEVINLNDIDLPRFVRRDEEVLREHATYGQAKYNNADKDFSIRAGMRANYISKFQEILLEPRLSIRKSLNEYIEVEVMGEFKHQNTSQIVNFQNDFLGIERRRWQLTDNDSIPILKSKQASIAAMFKKKGWLIDVKGFYKKVDGITTQSQSFTTKYEFERTQGSYDVYGVELLLRKQFKNISSWLSYSYLNNIYRFQGLEEDQFPSNFDITHSFTLGSTYNEGFWDLSAGLNYRSGTPTSIPLLVTEVVDGNINFDQANNQRLQAYLRIDASAMYKYRINDRFKSEIGISMWNILNRQNEVSHFYRLNSNNEPTQFTRYSLGITSNLVFRLYF